MRRNAIVTCRNMLQIMLQVPSIEVCLGQASGIREACEADWAQISTARAEAR